MRRRPARVYAPQKAFEVFLLRGDPDVVARCLLYLSPPDLFALSRLNTHLRYWFYTYCAKAWDFIEFARHYVYRPRSLLAHMDGKNSMMYGYSVLRFMLRCASGYAPLDICTNLVKFSAIQSFLDEEGYTCAGLHPDYTWSTVEDKIGALIRRTHNMDSWTWNFNRDRCTRFEDLRGYLFRFNKGFARNRRRINLYLIRCEPHRHVLSSPITPFTCYMTGEKLVSPFANSTFRHMKAFTLEGQQDPKLAVPGSSLFVQGMIGRSYEFEIVNGPPKSTNHLNCAEIGVRREEDKHCWIVERIMRDPMKERPAFHGSTYEVIDWRMLHDEEGTYMRIGEPFVLSSKFFHLLRTEGRALDPV